MCTCGNKTENSFTRGNKVKVFILLGKTKKNNISFCFGKQLGLQIYFHKAKDFLSLKKTIKCFLSLGKTTTDNH